MDLKTKLLLGLLIAAVLDMIIPVPFMAIFLVYVLFTRPPWFREWVNRIYQGDAS